MGVNEARTKFEAAKKAVASCQTSIAELQRKSVSLQESLPGLSRAVEDAEKVKESVLDAFALSSNKQAEQTLKGARESYDNTQRKLAETHELAKATRRALKKQEQEFVGLNYLCEVSKCECWESIADEIRVSIHSEVFENVQKLFVIGSQCGQTRSWLLDSLFPNIPSGEFQTIRTELVKKYAIDE